MNSNVPIKVLVVDHDEEVKHFLKEPTENNIIFSFCNEATKILDAVKIFSPELILQEATFPDIDGLMLLHYLKEDIMTSEIPVVFFTHKKDSSTKIEAFHRGASDYIVKFPEKEEFFARIQYHGSMYRKNMEKTTALEALSREQYSVQKELSSAAEYLNSFFPKPMHAGGVSIDYRYLPTRKVGGDALGYGWIDDENCIFFLIDVAGKGIKAALCACVLLHNFQAGLLKMDTIFYTPKELLEKLNKEFYVTEHNSMSFSCWYGIYNKRTKELRYAAAGYPKAVLVEKEHVLLLQANGEALGVHPEALYEEMVWSITPDSILYVFSDGAFEIGQKNGELLGIDTYMQLLQQPSFGKVFDLDRIMDYICVTTGKETFDDDITILRASFEN